MHCAVKCMKRACSICSAGGSNSCGGRQISFTYTMHDGAYVIIILTSKSNAIGLLVDPV